MSQTLSDLGLDLALSRVRLAAAKAKANLDLAPVEIEAAASLSGELTKRLNEMKRSTTVPASLVSGEQLRSRLEEAMSTLTPVRTERLGLRAELLEQLLPALRELATAGRLAPDQAKLLLDELIALVPLPEEVREFVPPESLYK